MASSRCVVTIDRAGAVKDARVVQGHPMLREPAVNGAAMEIRAGHCPGVRGDAEVQLCDSTAEFKGAGANDAPLGMTAGRNDGATRKICAARKLPFHADYLAQGVHDFHQIRLCRHYCID